MLSIFLQHSIASTSIILLVLNIEVIDIIYNSTIILSWVLGSKKALVFRLKVHLIRFSYGPKTQLM
jgi:hypothetical protein